MAIITPLLFALIFGMIEFGWAFYQHMDVRHGAREGARLAAVDFGDSEFDLRDAVCARMDERGNLRVFFERADDATIGDEGTVRVEKDLETLTGFYDFMLDDLDLKSSVNMRLEQEPSWDDWADQDDALCP